MNTGQTGPKRTRLQREKDLQDIGTRYLQGEQQWSIAESLHLNQSQISRDLAVLLHRWQKVTTMNLDAAKAKELAKIDALELVYWASWQESRGEKSRTLTRQTQSMDARTMAQIIKEQSDGNPQFLQGVQWCIDKRCKIFGFDAPVKVAPTTPDGKEAWSGLSEKELAARMLAVINAGAE